MQKHRWRENFLAFNLQANDTHSPLLLVNTSGEMQLPVSGPPEIWYKQII